MLRMGLGKAGLREKKNQGYYFSFFYKRAQTRVSEIEHGAGIGGEGGGGRKLTFSKAQHLALLYAF